MKSKINQYVIIILGFLMFGIFIWLRFIRKRLPKEIPFDLYFRGLMILVFISISYFLILKSLVRPSRKANIYLEEIIPILYKPLDALDDFIKQFLDLTVPMKLLQKILYYLIVKTHSFYIMFAIMPRIILVSILTYDVFLENKLHYIYYVIVYLAILLFLNRYIIYSIKRYTTSECLDMEKNVSHITTDYVGGVHPLETKEDLEEYGIPPTMSLPLKNFIDFQTSLVLNNFLPQSYDINVSKNYREVFKKRYNISSEEYITKNSSKIIVQEINTILFPKIELLLSLNLIIGKYNLTNTENKIFKGIKIIIYSFYLTCWAYILVKSCPHAHWDEILKTFMHTLSYEKEPFSYLPIYYQDLHEY